MNIHPKVAVALGHLDESLRDSDISDAEIDRILEEIEDKLMNEFGSRYQPNIAPAVAVPLAIETAKATEPYAREAAKWLAERYRERTKQKRNPTVMIEGGRTTLECEYCDAEVEEEEMLMLDDYFCCAECYIDLVDRVGEEG